jgi:flagellar biosynthesis GTPase FlhF
MVKPTRKRSLKNRRKTKKTRRCKNKSRCKGAVNNNIYGGDTLNDLTFFLDKRLLKKEYNTTKYNEYEPNYDNYNQEDIKKIYKLRDGESFASDDFHYEYINELENKRITGDVAKQLNKLLNEIYEHFKKEKQQQEELKKKIREQEQEYNKIKEQQEQEYNKIKEQQEQQEELKKKIREKEQKEKEKEKEEEEQKEPNANVILKQTIKKLNIIDVDSEFTNLKSNFVEKKDLEDITKIKSIVDNIKEDKVKKRVKRYLFLKYKNIYDKECEKDVNSSECKIWNRFYDDIYDQKDDANK